MTVKRKGLKLKGTLKNMTETDYSQLAIHRSLFSTHHSPNK